VRREGPLIKENAREPNTYPDAEWEGACPRGGRACGRQTKKIRDEVQPPCSPPDDRSAARKLLLTQRKPHPEWTESHAGVNEPGLEDRLVDLHSRVHRGAFRATPSRRVYIEKEDGRQRPLGLRHWRTRCPTRVVAILNQIYEEDFLGFRTVFVRDAASIKRWMRCRTRSLKKKVNYVLDADIGASLITSTKVG